MAAVLEWLNGKKSYIIAIVGGVFQILVSIGVIDVTAEWVGIADALFLALFGVALRAGVAKSGPAQ
jgi:hypothetical protein